MYTTLLDLCNSVIDEAGISGEMTSVVNQKGELRRIVNYVQRACTLIEGKWVNWNYLHEFHIFETVPGVRDYPPQVGHGFWDTSTIRIPANESNLSFVRYELKKEDPSAAISGEPYEMTVLPNQTLRFFNTPDSAYGMSIEYWRAPTVLVTNTDQPSIPLQYRDIIVYKALEFYAKYESADELLLQARDDYKMRLTQLEAREMPGSHASGALSTGIDIQVVAESGGSNYYNEY
jgi:hypothetical protein